MPLSAFVCYLIEQTHCGLRLLLLGVDVGVLNCLCACYIQPMPCMVLSELDKYEPSCPALKQVRAFGRVKRVGLQAFVGAQLGLVGPFL